VAALRWGEKTLRTSEATMPIDNVVGLIATVLLLIYLFYTLLHPEKF